MACTEREELREALHNALRELAWIYEEELRLAAVGGFEQERFKEILLPQAQQAPT
jgi:hypothetical protein